MIIRLLRIIITGGVGMAYKIQYSPEAAHRYPAQKHHPRGNLWRWIPIVLVLAAALWMRVKGIPDFLIPGDPTVTRAAAAMMMDELRAGVSPEDAITVFCQEILHGAGL